jgi:hypothetical protein
VDKLKLVDEISSRLGVRAEGFSQESDEINTNVSGLRSHKRP